MDVSNSEKERPCVSGGDSGGGGGGGGDDDDEDDDVGGGGENRSGHRYKRDFRRATKEVVMFPFRKAQKLQQRRQLKQQQNPPNGNHVCSGSGGGGGGGGAIKVSRRGKRMMGCCLCSKQPLTLESPLDSHSSDPNNPDFFCYDSLKNLIENSDFYTKECNTHVDIICPHPD